MIRILAIAAVLAAPVADAQEVVVPSGLSIVLQEIRLEEEPRKMARFRFVAPAIKGGAVAFADLVDDVDFLCAEVVLPGLADNGWTDGNVVISLAEVPTEFGTPAPDITQYFQPYRVVDGACIWEPF
ncbi:DUF6497 family protein [Yoonia sp. 208BN28-4]|uniref:DUF6497 family protein n=1 Tax=Yoonia sp. 208BN28-4 TaxID=3126505 RepID=UPI0030AF3F60